LFFNVKILSLIYLENIKKYILILFHSFICHIKGLGFHNSEKQIIPKQVTNFKGIISKVACGSGHTLLLVNIEEKDDKNEHQSGENNNNNNNNNNQIKNKPN
jgi:hypothetical protein